MHFIYIKFHKIKLSFQTKTTKFNSHSDIELEFICLCTRNAMQKITGENFVIVCTYANVRLVLKCPENRALPFFISFK